MQPTITQPGLDEISLPNHPETKVWLKKRPKAGDKIRAQCASYVSLRTDGSTDPDLFARYILTRTLVMVHDWTVTDESGKRIPISIEAIEALDPEDADFLGTEARSRYESGVGSSPLASNSASSSPTESTFATPEPSTLPASEN